MPKTTCFFTPDGKHLYVSSRTKCEICGDEKKLRRGIYRTNRRKDKKVNQHDSRQNRP
jgi:hypothetical protein